LFASCSRLSRLGITHFIVPLLFYSKHPPLQSLRALRKLIGKIPKLLTCVASLSTVHSLCKAKPGNRDLMDNQCGVSPAIPCRYWQCVVPTNLRLAFLRLSRQSFPSLDKLEKGAFSMALAYAAATGTHCPLRHVALRYIACHVFGRLFSLRGLTDAHNATWQGKARK
jgi:hypothetical protein